MSLSEKFVTLDELCAATRRTAHWWRRNHRRLHLDAGMPEKSALGWLWPRKALERWIDGEGFAAAPEPAAAGTADARDGARDGAIAANQNRALRARYAGRAGA